MRALALLAFLLAQSIQPAQQDPPEWQPDPHRCVSLCAAIEKDAGGMKACKCAAGKGTSCDANGNRTQEEMSRCVNKAHCLKGCCHCCPKD